MAELNKNPNHNQQTLGLYTYNSSTVGDAIGDTRTSNQASVYKVEVCTVANAVKAGGTWVTAWTHTLTTDTVWMGVGNLPTETSVTNMLSGKGTLISGSCTIIDNGITVNSWATVCVSTVGVSTSVPIKFTASAGSMLFTTGQITDTAEFGYIIFI